MTRAAAEGVRVYAVSIVVAIALGTGEVASIAIITALTLIYTFEGGLAAVIWTDVVQTVIYVGGTLVGLFTILHLVPGRLAGDSSPGGERGQAAGFRFHARLLEALHVLGGIDRRDFLDHGQSRNRSVDCAASVGGAKPAAVCGRAAFERSGDSLPVCLVPHRRGHAVRVLSRALGEFWARRTGSIRHSSSARCRTGFRDC